MESVAEKDYFAHTPKKSAIQHESRPATNVKRPSVAFANPPERPHPMSRMSTHRVDQSATNFAQVLDDAGGPDGLQNLNIDYFNTVLDVFKDQKQHHSPVVFDFMLLHEINIHRLEHLLIAEWDWLTIALSDETSDRQHLSAQAPRRLAEVQDLLHKYCMQPFVSPQIHPDICQLLR